MRYACRSPVLSVHAIIQSHTHRSVQGKKCVLAQRRHAENKQTPNAQPSLFVGGVCVCANIEMNKHRNATVSQHLSRISTPIQVHSCRQRKAQTHETHSGHGKANPHTPMVRQTKSLAEQLQRDGCHHPGRGGEHPAIYAP